MAAAGVAEGDAWIFGYGSLMCADSRSRSGQTGLAVRSAWACAPAARRSAHTMAMAWPRACAPVLQCHVRRCAGRRGKSTWWFAAAHEFTDRPEPAVAAALCAPSPYARARARALRACARALRACARAGGWGTGWGWGQVPVNVAGIQRRWGAQVNLPASMVVHPGLTSISAVSVEEEPGSRCNGVIVKVLQSEIPAFDEREAGYTRQGTCAHRARRVLFCVAQCTFASGDAMICTGARCRGNLALARWHGPCCCRHPPTLTHPRVLDNAGNDAG